MKRSLFAIAALAIAVASLDAQSASDLFQKALSKERVDGQVAEAIALYERVVQESAGDRALAAKALLQIGRCYERLGRIEAQNTYERIVREYSDQRAAADEARARLAATFASEAKDHGTAGRQVWAGDTVDTSGSISPDGRYLSFTDWETGDLAIRDLATGKNRRLTDKGSWEQSSGFAEGSVISRDGRTIVYTWCSEGACELRTIPRTGGAWRLLYRHDDVSYAQAFDWSTDGKKIVVALQRADRTNQIAVITTGDGAPRVLKTLDWRKPWKAAFSPDALFIAYDLPSDPDAPERDVFLLAVDGSREVSLSAHRAHDVLLGWKPRSDRVYFASDRRGTNGIWSIQVYNGRPHGEAEFVKPEIGRILALNFSEAGDYYYGLSTARTDVRIAALDPVAGTLVGALDPIKTRFEQGKLAGVWSPAGKEIAYLVSSTLMRGGGGGNTLAVQTIDSGQVRSIPLPLNYSNRLRWMPDGRSLIVGGTDMKGRRGLFRVELSSGRLEPLFYDRVGRFGIGPNATSLVYERRGDPHSAIVTRDLRSGEERELYRARGAVGVALSPDGRWIALKVNLPNGDGTASPYPSIQVAPAAGGEPRTIVTFAETDVSDWREMAWSADGKFIFFTVRHGGLSRVAAAGGAPVRLADLTFINSISVHPDGSRLAVSEGSGRYEVWNAPLHLPGTAGSRPR